MSLHESTCWTVIRDAARGDDRARGEFTRSYLAVVRAYLAARWRRGPMSQWLDDAVQDVFLECFRPDGPLGRADADEGSRFRTFLYAVVRNVARRYEERRGGSLRTEGAQKLEVLAAPEESLALVFDRAWARHLLDAAVARHAAQAEAGGDAAQRRVELLRLRLGEARPIREIAELWSADPAFLHAEYRTARDEFKRALREEVLFHNPGCPGARLDEECIRILKLVG